jgi:hypothetical protein
MAVLLHQIEEQSHLNYMLFLTFPQYIRERDAKVAGQRTDLPARFYYLHRSELGEYRLENSKVPNNQICDSAG